MERRQQAIERQWIQALPEIINTLRSILASQGREAMSGDEEWARKAKTSETENIDFLEEGDSETGPYRLTVYSRTTEDGGIYSEPLLKLEIRPAQWWFNEVKSFKSEAKKAEPVPV